MGIVGLNGVLVPGRRGLSQEYAMWGGGMRCICLLIAIQLTTHSLKHS
jgi:hypothetical protein